MELANVFIARIEQLRKQKGLSQEAFAEKLNMTRQNYYRILKRPETITIKQMVQFADTLEGSLPYLLFSKIRDPEREKEIAELQVNMEALRIKNQYLSLSQENTHGLFKYFFYRTMDVLLMQINREIGEETVEKDYQDILNQPIDDIKKIGELFELAIWNYLDPPEYFSLQKIHRDVLQYARVNKLTLEKKGNKFWIKQDKKNFKVRMD